MYISKKLFLSLVCLLSISKLGAEAVVFGRSFFVAPSLFRQASVENVAGTRYDLQIASQDRRQRFEINMLGQASICSGHLSNYFLPNGGQPNNRHRLVTGELGCTAAVDGTLDVIAKYFNVLTAPLPASTGDDYVVGDYKFESNLTFKPKRDVFGCNFTYHYHLSQYLDKGWWIEVNAPLVVARHDLGMQEDIVTTGGPTGSNPVVPAGYYGNMTQAFNSSTWSYGKINGSQTKIGMGELQARLGYIFVNEQHYYLNTYFGALVPLSGRPANTYLFEPTISGHHIGIFSGASASVRVWSNCDKAIYWTFDTAGTLLFANSQLRSLDLQGRPWSRYLPVFLSANATTMNPGINSFTQPVQVTPDTVRDLNIAYVYKQEGLHLELGYHFFARSAEKLKLLHAIDSELAIASDLLGRIGSTPKFEYQDPSTSGGSQISRDFASIDRYLQVSNDQQYTDGTDIYLPLTNASLDLTSAAHPAYMSNSFYGAFGYHYYQSNYPLFFGAGAAWEIGNDNGALSQIMLWGKADLSF